MITVDVYDSLSCLGYQHVPVLMERELLTVQSPRYCRNIFKTSVTDIAVNINSSGEVYFLFRSVADINAFLFEVSNSRGQRTLGELKKNCKDLVLKPQEGVFILHARDDANVLESLSGNFQFITSVHPDGFAELKFKVKTELFKFFLSSEGKKLQQLTFDERQILNNSNETKTSIRELKIEPSAVKVERERGMARSQGEVTSDNEPALGVFEKDGEIRVMKSKLKNAEEIIQRQLNQNKKLQSKYFTLMDQLQKILCNHKLN